VRYYHQIGLLPVPAARGGVRDYDVGHLARMLRIRWLADAGVSLAEIDAMLARLQSLSDDHFNVHPDAINWGHVGSLDHHAALLKRITDAAFTEGEHAE
jgi:DNA-binding transcriptional MerR regulator